MTHSPCRSGGVIALVIIQLVILPATQLLHVGCEHPLDVHSSVANSTDHTVETIWSWCWSAHCCDHCQQSSVTGDELTVDGRAAVPKPRQPVHPPHDENTCPVCLVAFAARLTTAATTPTLTDERIAAIAVRNPIFEKPTPRYSVLSRGPPAERTGPAA
ncbi:MAG: hypothetical protein R3C59_13960 [Planctomycetaceae bacterium]